VFAKLAADISVRKHDGIVFDTNLLDLDENQIIMRFREDGGAVIVVVYMVQQLHCVRNKKGEILEVSVWRFFVGVCCVVWVCVCLVVSVFV
jgi:hypothetical protein